MKQKRLDPPLHFERVSGAVEQATGKKYRLLTPNLIYIKKYDKYIDLKVGMLSDGATGAIDIHSWGWWGHDQLCETGVWADGTPCNNWEASTALAIILAGEKRYARSVYWWWATWMLGGDQARKNGMW